MDLCNISDVLLILSFLLLDAVVCCTHRQNWPVTLSPPEKSFVPPSFSLPFLIFAEPSHGFVKHFRYITDPVFFATVDCHSHGQNCGPPK